MPGIFGLISPRPDCDLIVDRMLAVLRHNQSLASCRHAFPSASVAAGLTSFDADLVGQTPIWNEQKDIALLISGEPYPLPTGSPTNQSPSGTAQGARSKRWILDAYQSDPDGFLRNVGGWFAGLIVDRRAGRTLLFNDRFGLGRLYIHQNANGTFFATEAKAILAICPATRSLESQSLAETVSVGCVMQNRSLFRGIEVLPPASVLTFLSTSECKRRTYFAASEWESLPPLSGPEYTSRLSSELHRALGECLQGPLSVGISLTGGLDSRMILACLGNQGSRFLSYTFVGPYRECADATIARRIAAVAGSSHVTIPIPSQFFAEFPSLAASTTFLSDGTMDASGAVELYVNRIAKGIAPVRLTGNYGSEVVRSNVAFRPSRQISPVFEPGFRERIHGAAETYAAEAKGDRLSFILFKQVPWHHFSRLSIEQSQLIPRTPFLDPGLVRTVYSASPEHRNAMAPSLKLIADASLPLARIPTDRGFAPAGSGPVDRIRNLWQELTVRAEYAFDYGMPPWLTRMDRTLKPLALHRLFLGRHKFYHFRVWYRDYLHGFIRETLLSPRALGRSYVDAEKVRAAVQGHLSGAENHTSLIHRLLTMELIHRELLERDWSARPL